jgi:hypothetical protein
LIVRFLKSVLTGMGGTVVALVLFFIAELAFVLITVPRQQQTGLQVYRVVSWPVYVAAAFGFILAFGWMWRRS